MARVIETKRCAIPITPQINGERLSCMINGWGVCIEADTYEEAYNLACNAIRPMVEEDIEQRYSFSDESEHEEDFFNAFQ